MSKNKNVHIIVIVICVVILGSAVVISALHGGKAKTEPASSAPQTSQQTASQFSAQADGTTTLPDESTTGDTETQSETETGSTAATSGSSAASASSSSSGTTKTASAAAASRTTAGTTKKTSAAGQYLYAYAGFNPQTTDMSVPFEQILLNRKYKLPDGYVPTLAEAVRGSGVKLDYRVAPHYQEMYNAAKQDGITLTPVSGYRSYERQKNNFEDKIQYYVNRGYSRKEATIKASEVRLLPGTSEHNAGLAMDICSLNESFDQTKEFRWLNQHAHEYGFILRYPKNKTNVTKIIYEPWHYRYVGTEIAAKLKASGQVLEEYLGKDA